MRSKAGKMIRGESARFRRGPWFLVALLLALASTLVPALSPLGAVTPVHMLGSAFDPTNNVETLRGRDHEAALAAAVRQEANRAPAAGAAPAVLAVSPQEMMQGAQAHPALLPSVPLTAPAVLASPRSPALPRAPPVRVA